MKYDIEALKRKMLVKYPFFGNVVAGVKYKEERSVGTAGTAGKIIYYNPDFLEKLSTDEQTMDQTNELNVQANQPNDTYEEMVQQLEDSSSKDKIIFSIIEKMYPDGVEFAPVNDINRLIHMNRYCRKKL